MSDTLAEWLRRQPAKLLGLSRAGSNPAGVDVVVVGSVVRKEISNVEAADSSLV